MNISIIVAMDQQGVIGNHNKLPWRLKNDMMHFKELTTGKCVLMGRKTYESIGKPLPNRFNIVVSTTLPTDTPGIAVVRTVYEGINLARHGYAAESRPEAELMVIGGEAIYKQLLPMADTLYLTSVATRVEGDAVIELDFTDGYTIVSNKSHPKDADNEYSYRFLTLKKK